MKGKTITASLFALLLVFGSLAMLPVHSASTATMYVEPASIDGLDIGDTFTATIMFKDFVDLWTWQVQIFWDPSVINCTGFKYGVKLSDNVYEVLAPGREYLQNSGGLVPGKLLGTASSLTSPPTTGVTGEAGVGYKLVELYFKVVGYGSIHTIDFDDPPLKTFWLNSASLVKQPCNFEPGTVETIAPPTPYGPTAAFTWTPTIPQNGTDVTFDARSSKPGFDGTHMCPITCWRWNFGDGTGWFNCSDKEVWVHNFAEPNTYTVYLEVYAPGAPTETNSTTHDVKVIPPPMGAHIELTAPEQAPYDGEGPDVECDAFAPQQMVVLKAKVTYNLDPVEGKIVGFEVLDASGACVTYRTAVTNASGIAVVEFRIPSMPAFGDWLAIAIVDVAQTTVADTMPFKVGWIIEILSVAPLETTYHKCNDMYFTLEIKNIALSTRTTTLTVVVYDECGVPIGQIVVPDWPIEARFDGYYATTMSIHVPTWAFVGTATVYANAFTALPSLNGVPYCPEQSAEFVIERIQ